MERDRMRRETLDDDTLSLFCSQLSLMLQAGIGVEEGAALLAGDADEPGQRTLLAGLRAGLDRGEPLSQALEATGGFPDYLLRMVEIGQASGRLDQVLAALGRYYARQADTRRALRRAVAYPAVMAVLIAVIFLVLVARVLPVFQQVFVQLGVELSPVAAALLRFGSAGQAVTAAAAVVLALCALLLVWLLRAQTGAAALSGLFARTRAARALGRSAGGKEGDLLRLCRGDVRHAPQPEHPLQAGGGLCRDHVSCLDQRIYRRRGLGGQGDLF